MTELEKAAYRAKRRNALSERPIEPLKDSLPCKRCGRRIPSGALATEEWKLYAFIDTVLYCKSCAMKVAGGLEAAMLAMSDNDRAEHFRSIHEKITQEAFRKMDDEAGVDEVVEYEDAKKMKHLLRNRDGTVETKTLLEKNKENLTREAIKRSVKKIIVPTKKGD